MAISASLAPYELTDLCLRCVGGLNRIDALYSDADVNGLSGGTAQTDLLALLVTNAAGLHDEAQQSVRQVNVALQYAIDVGILDATNVDACTTKADLKTIFVNADPQSKVTVDSIAGDVWNS